MTRARGAGILAPVSVDGYQRVLEIAEERALRYLEAVSDRPVRESASVDELRDALARELPDSGEDPAKVVEELAEAAEPGVIALASPRYFGFVIGGAMPAAMGADWLATAWDQIGSLYVCGPSASVAEEVAGGWVLDLVGLPETSGFGLTTGGTMANFAGIAAGRGGGARVRPHEAAGRTRAGRLGRRGARTSRRPSSSDPCRGARPRDHLRGREDARPGQRDRNLRQG